MQQIADWLEKLGLSEYADRFAENRIDFSVLPDLTDQDLEKLGVLLGDRRKMLRAIAKLDAPIAVATTTPATPRSVDTAERRQVTVGRQRVERQPDHRSSGDQSVHGLPGAQATGGRRLRGCVEP